MDDSLSRNGLIQRDSSLFTKEQNPRVEKILDRWKENGAPY